MSQTLEDGTVVYTQTEIDQQVADAKVGLERNRDMALTEAKTAKAEFAKLKERIGDLDLDAVRQMMADSAEAKRKQAEKDGDWAAIEANLKDAHAKELGMRDAREKKLMSTVEKSLVTAELTRAIAGKEGDSDLLLPHARQFVRTRETDSGFEAYVVDAAGNPAVADGQGTPMSFDQLVESQLVEQFPRAFAGTGSSGSGASKSADGVGGSVVTADPGTIPIGQVEDIASGAVTVR